MIISLRLLLLENHGFHKKIMECGDYISKPDSSVNKLVWNRWFFDVFNARKP
jgi:hypothetical protein